MIVDTDLDHLSNDNDINFSKSAIIEEFRPMVRIFKLFIDGFNYNLNASFNLFCILSLAVF